MKGNHKMSTKEELQSELNSLNELNSSMSNEIDSLNETIVELESKIETLSALKDGRKSQVLKLLQDNESISIVELAEQINISTKNVSSQLTYLRSDGYKIFTDHNGRKVLMP